jgi:hypothetical protein
VRRATPAPTGSGTTRPAPLPNAALYEDDDLIPVCLGGDNASPLNHWQQPDSTTPGAVDKDMLEERICREVCRSRRRRPADRLLGCIRQRLDFAAAPDAAPLASG